MASAQSEKFRAAIHQNLKAITYEIRDQVLVLCPINETRSQIDVTPEKPSLKKKKKLYNGICYSCPTYFSMEKF